MPSTDTPLPALVAERLAKHLAERGIRRKPRVYADTYDSMSIDFGDVIIVKENCYLITGFEKEGRFGIDDQLKYWVKKAINVVTDERCIIKCVFYETFQITVGSFKVTCYRNPDKESRVLKLVQGKKHFMQGYGIEDEGGNLLRILDIIWGKRLDNYIFSLGESHLDYYQNHLPSVLTRFLNSLKGIAFLHANGLKHGDIRRDHIFVEHGTGIFKWIDFDYDFHMPERPFALDLFGLANILLFIVGRGTYRHADLRNDLSLGERVLETITDDDLSLLFKDRIVNLQKIFPYIHPELNNILMHFSHGTNVFYDTVEELYLDLNKFLMDNHWLIRDENPDP